MNRTVSLLMFLSLAVALVVGGVLHDDDLKTEEFFWGGSPWGHHGGWGGPWDYYRGPWGGSWGYGAGYGGPYAGFSAGVGPFGFGFGLGRYGGWW